MYKVFLSVHVCKKPPILKPLSTWRRFTWAFCPWRAGHRQECPGTQSTADGARGDTAVPRWCAALHGTDRSPMPWQQQGTPRAWTPQPPARRNNTFTYSTSPDEFWARPSLAHSHSLPAEPCCHQPRSWAHLQHGPAAAAPGQLQPTAEPGWRGVPAPPHPHSTAAPPRLTPIGSIGPRPRVPHSARPPAPFLSGIPRSRALGSLLSPGWCSSMCFINSLHWNIP